MQCPYEGHHQSIVNWLKPLMTKLTGDSKSSFVLGRQAADNIILAKEVIHTMRRKKQDLMATNIDLEKAHDRVEWDLLKKIL